VDVIKWWRRRKYNLTWKRVEKDVRRAFYLSLFIDNNEHHSDEALAQFKKELIDTLHQLEQDLDHL